ncbi:MAG: hypothetical protein VR77_08850 [Flavobacteriales bacterium BRH_c54]|nr:MAG: hypothetical protein VR77_08850 [Flavobacteriales bacterium BRH_c54]
MFKSLRNKIRSIFKPDDDSNLNGHKIDFISDLPEVEKKKVLRMVEEKREKELNNHPKIAIIGKTGVGKSSTINNLFRVNLGVSHFEACTKDAEPVIISNGKGKIIIYDMPGLGEDLDKDEQHKKLYKKVLPQCDVVLWILNIADREMSSQQTHIKEISEYLENTLVICANKADILEPSEWIETQNLPSIAQEENLKKRIADIRKKLCKIIPDLEEDRIVYYSAKRKYRMNDLFRAMMDACPIKRAWVLESRMDVAEFTELVDLEILKQLKNGRKE